MMAQHTVMKEMRWKRRGGEERGGGRKEGREGGWEGEREGWRNEPPNYR